MVTKVVFDRYYFNLDGALLDSQADIIDCLRSAVRMHSHDVADDQSLAAQYLGSWGRSINDLISELCGCDVTVAEQIAAEYQRSCLQRGFVKTVVTEDMHELLHRLNRNGGQLHCISSYIPDPETVLREKNLHQYFHRVSNTMHSRMSWWQQEQRAGALRNACIVSDRVIDLRYGVSQNCVTAAVTWGADDSWDLGLETPEVILTDAAQCRQYLIDGVLPGK